MDNNYFNINKQELENKSKNILEKLSDEEIKDKASKYKKNQIIGMSVIAGIALVAFTTFFLLFAFDFRRRIYFWWASCFLYNSFYFLCWFLISIIIFNIKEIRKRIGNASN